MKVPGFLLKRLYVKGSLRNTPEGFEFKLKNSLGSGYAYGLLPLTVDGTEISIEQACFSVDGRSLAFNQVSKATPATLAMNREATISVRGHTLTPGPHRIGMGFLVTGLGELRFDLTDTVAEA